MTHTGEEWFVLGKQDYYAIAFVMFVYVLLALSNKLPSMSVFKEFTDTINTAGGHILILLSMTIWATRLTMRLFFHILSISSDTITKQDALINMFLTFCTTSLIMLPMGALIKTMTGGLASNGNGTVTSFKVDASTPNEVKK
jgi:hypothetical protein